MTVQCTDSLRSWNHLSRECLSKIHDDLLRAETELDVITACFQCMLFSSLARDEKADDFVVQLFPPELVLCIFWADSFVELHRNSYTFIPSSIWSIRTRLLCEIEKATKFRNSKVALCPLPTSRVSSFDDATSFAWLRASAGVLERGSSSEMSETMGLAAFLKQIGAASLSPKLVLPVAGAKAPLALLHARLEAEIESVNVSESRFAATVEALLMLSRGAATNAVAAAGELARIRAAIQFGSAAFRANGRAGAAPRCVGG